jgi:hypothetical protein
MIFLERGRRGDPTMHIDNTYLTNRTVGQPEDLSPAADAPRRPDAPVPPLPDVSVHVPSPELLQLLARVRQAPEVREEVLQRVAQKLATGYYHSDEAAEQTAEAILRAGE